MSIELLAQLFPPPRYLSPPVVGLDLSDRSLKFVALARDGRHRFRLERFGEKALPLDIISSGQIKDKPALIELLRTAQAEWRLEKVIVALPEESAYIFQISLPVAASGDEREAIELQLEEHVPLPASDVVFDYELTSADHRQALVSVFPRTLVKDYEEVLAAALLQPLAFEVEAQAIARSLVPHGAPQTVLVIDFGKTRTSFLVARRGQVLFTSTTRQLGGDIITRAIEKNLNLPTADAEALKINQGLLAGPEQDRLAMGLVPVLSVLRDEVLKLYSYWEKHLSESGDEGKIDRIILCGGEAVLPGLIDYLRGQQSLPIELGNVWINTLDLNRAVPAIAFRQSLRYATAIGLALRAK